MDRVIVFGTIDEGSIPPGRTESIVKLKIRVASSVVEQSPLKRLAVGSSPTRPTSERTNL